MTTSSPIPYRLTKGGAEPGAPSCWRGTDATAPAQPFGKANVMTLPLSFQLGHAESDLRPRRVDDAPGRTFYLPRLEAVLTVEYRSGDGWRCAVIARRCPRPDARHALLSYTEIVAAPATVVVDADDHDAVAMVWVAEVWRRWRGGLVHLGARTLAEDIRIPGTLVAEVDLHALARLAEVTRLRSPGIRRLLDRLATAGLLTSVESHADRGWGSYALRPPGLTADARAQPPPPP
jgi:hypothetical protein